jgi:hypothetical protein
MKFTAISEKLAGLPTTIISSLDCRSPWDSFRLSSIANIMAAPANERATKKPNELTKCKNFQSKPNKS